MQASRRIVKSKGQDNFGVVQRRMFDDGFDDMFSNFFGGSSLFGRNRDGGRFGDLMMRDPFSDILSGFDDIRMPGTGSSGNSLMNFGGGNGQCVSQTFVYSQTMGKDGKPKVEKYFNSNIQGTDKNGRRVGQMEEMYKNTETGIKKMAEQRILGDKGRKIVKTKHGEGKRNLI